MKFSEQWLREWIDPPITCDQLLAQLTNAGLEVDSIMPVAAEFTGVVVAEIIAVQPHPNADRLRICQVNVGQAEPITIVTNDSTVQAGMKVAAALLGAQLPELAIKPISLHGIDSSGMFCSAKTLGISDDDSGSLSLDHDATVGSNLRDYLQLNDIIIDIEVTPNRGDCLSIMGIAREVAVANQVHGQGPVIKPIMASISDEITVQLEAPEACPHYVVRIIRGINPLARSPQWLQQKLYRSGLRSIHPVVDVTNYVMLELGQPLHAFDLNVVGNKLVVGYAGQADGTETLLLNGEKCIVRPDTLTIKDASASVLAIAGIIGAAQGSIGSTTTDIILESAFFTPLNLAGKARQYGLHTDSSYRFERGVDPQLQLQAIERATGLLVHIVGGQAGPCTEIISAMYLPTPRSILLREASIKRLLGCSVPNEQITAILSGLAMRLKPVALGWQVTPPSFRFDIAIEVDLIEEIGRIFGYDHIPYRLPLLKANMLPEPKQQMRLQEARLCLKHRAYHEAISYSFVDSKLQALLDTQHVALALTKPISADLAVMRTTLWASLLPILIYNQKRQQVRIRLFETGLRFIEQDGRLQQISTIAGLAWGSVFPEQWGIPSRQVDFYDVKSDIEALFPGETLSFTVGDYSAMHPGRSAQIKLDGIKLGYVGALHPYIEQQLAISGVYGFEIDLTSVMQLPLKGYEAVSKFPAIRRDIAIVVNCELNVDDIVNELKKIAGSLLNKIILFDIYEGKGVPSGQKSVAFGLLLQAPDRTLVDAEVKQLMKRIIDKLTQCFAATLREQSHGSIN